LCKHPRYKLETEQIDKIICFESPLYTFEEVSNNIEKRKQTTQKLKPEQTDKNEVPPTSLHEPTKNPIPKDDPKDTVIGKPETNKPTENQKLKQKTSEHPDMSLEEILKLVKEKNIEPELILVKEDENNPQFIMESDLGDEELAELFRKQIREIRTTLKK